MVDTSELIDTKRMRLLTNSGELARSFQCRMPAAMRAATQIQTLLRNLRRYAMARKGISEMKVASELRILLRRLSRIDWQTSSRDGRGCTQTNSDGSDV